jgi:hypothetical protein
MTLRDFAYGLLILGKPVVFWTGLLAIAMLIIAAAIMLLNRYAKTKIPFAWHHFFALGGLAVALIHMSLALTAYF